MRNEESKYCERFGEQEFSEIWKASILRNSESMLRNSESMLRKGNCHLMTVTFLDVVCTYLRYS